MPLVRVDDSEKGVRSMSKHLGHPIGFTAHLSFWELIRIKLGFL